MAEKTGWGKKIKGIFGFTEETIVTPQELTRDESFYSMEPVTVSMLLGSGKRAARGRSEIYEKLHFMMGDPIISAAIKLHVTNALGGDPATGNRIFIEGVPENGDSKEKQKIIDELNADLSDLFNRTAYSLAYNAIGFGDAYARPYFKDGVGIIDLRTDEMVWPPLVQPYEQGSKTVGYSVSAGKNFTERLTIKQMLRMKMPRLGYIAQNSVVQKSVMTSLTSDDLEDTPIQPALIGGTFLMEAEEPYDNLQIALQGMVSQRITGSIDESILTVNQNGMTKQQRKECTSSLEKMLTASKKRASDAIAARMPFVGRVFNVLPVNSEKQIVSIQQFQGTSGAQSYTIEDVMTYLKMLTGSIGIDLSMLGFADILSGGLGDGGFFRQSAQAAEVSQMMRKSLADFYYDAIDLHLYTKNGYTFEKGERPYRINFYGSVSALENEAAITKEKSMNSVAIMGQALSALKDLGLEENTMKLILSQEMKLDENMAELISKDMAAAKPPEEEF